MIGEIKRKSDLSALARETYKGNAKAQGTNYFSFGELRKSIVSERGKILEEIRNHDAEVKRISDEYRPHIARQKLANLPLFGEAMTEMNRLTKDKLKSELTDSVKTKRERMNNFICEAPGEKQIALLQLVSMRNGLISDGELSALIANMGGNFSALSTLQSLTVDENKSPRFLLPFDIEKNLAALDEAERILTQAIDKIDARDEELSIMETELLNYEDGMGYSSALLRELDEDFSFSEPDTSTELERLKQALSEAEENAINAIQESRTNHSPETVQAAKAAMDKHKELADFVQEHESELTTAEDLAHQNAKVVEQAENLIKGSHE